MKKSGRGLGQEAIAHKESRRGLGQEAEVAEPTPPVPTKPSTPSPKRKSRGSRGAGARPCLTHVEVRRGDALRLRVAISDDAIAEAGDELGALIRKISPAARPSSSNSPEVFVSPHHDPDDDAYHEDLRECLVDLFNSLCDASLADALEIVREVRARREEGGN